jgi:AraC-like DNA-binding protein
MEKLPWLEYTGQTTSKLIACKNTHRIASLLCAFEWGIQAKVGPGSEEELTKDEPLVLAVMALQYQKQLRLVAARERMLVEGIDAASAAFEVGYESASQFNREYKRFFGQPPMRDIKVRRLAGSAMVSD